MNVHLFYNFAPGDCIPAHDKWGNFKNPDTCKLAIFSQMLWEKQGWTVKRFTSKNTSESFDFKGRLKPVLEFYPVEFWNFWFAARDFLKGCNDISGGAWFTTLDVFNNSFSSVDGRLLSITREKDDRKANCITTKEGYTHSTFWCNREYTEEIIALIKWYDENRTGMPDLPGDLISDETIGRNFAEYSIFDLMSYHGIGQHWDRAPLIHVPRSVLQHYAAGLPSCNETGAPRPLL